jgi:hypothetical protein
MNPKPGSVMQDVGETQLDPDSDCEMEKADVEVESGTLAERKRPHEPAKWPAGFFCKRRLAALKGTVIDLD